MNFPKSVLLVRLGNICRSPSAEAVLRQKITQKNLDIVLDSAGTAGYHIGEKPDNRAITVGEKLGYDLSSYEPGKFNGKIFIVLISSLPWIKIILMTCKNYKKRLKIFI